MNPTPLISDTFPAWIYDGSEIPDPLGFGERAVRFLRMLRHPKSGRAFQLDPWQERIVRRIYGPRHEDGSRIVKTAVILVPRGNRENLAGGGFGSPSHGRTGAGAGGRSHHLGIGSQAGAHRL